MVDLEEGGEGVLLAVKYCAWPLFFPECRFYAILRQYIIYCRLARRGARTQSSREKEVKESENSNRNGKRSSSSRGSRNSYSNRKRKERGIAGTAEKRRIVEEK